MAFSHGTIVAVGENLHQSPEFAKFSKVNLKGRTVIPGLVDAHTHFYFYALSLGRVNVQGIDSLEGCLRRIRHFGEKLGRNEWIIGEGYKTDLFKVRTEPDRYALDAVSGGRPAFIYSKDQHSAWVNSRALQIAGVTRRTKDPSSGRIERFPDGEPTGILREGPAIDLVYDKLPHPSRSRVDRLYAQALAHAYRRGVTGVHSFDGPEAFAYFSELAEKGKLGLRINYYPQAPFLPQLRKTRTRYGTGDGFLRIAGIKIFADGSLGSRTALCFNAYKDRPGNYGIEVVSAAQILKYARSAARLGLPVAVHAIGDRAVSNVLDALEQAPPLKPPRRHRIEHLQLMRRKDIARVKRIHVIGSMQPQQTLSDIEMMRDFWGARSANAYIYRTLLDRGVDLAFGSDVPIEPLDPLAGIEAAVRRARPGSRDVFHPEQRITATEALFAFTAGAAIACGQQDCRGYLLPGYPADFAVLADDITRIAPSRIRGTEVLATVLNGAVKYADRALKL